MKKIIFLDIDGVLNSGKSFSDKNYNHHASLGIGEEYHSFYPEYKQRLNKLIETYDAKIVISSTWRKYYGLSGMASIWENEKMSGEIIGVTGVSSCGFRGLEIDKWIDDNLGYIVTIHQDVMKINCDKVDLSNYLIIDDDSDMTYYQRYNFCHTRFATGFDEISYEKSNEILSKNLWDFNLF